jgi:hypothetical protein
MLPLRAVDPHGLRVVDEDRVCRDRHVGRGDGHEAREDAGQVRVHADGLAGVVEVGLRDGVVFGHELELNHVAFLGGDVVGAVGEGAVAAADGYDVDGY